MPKKNRSVEDHLQSIEYMLAAILLKREPNIKTVAKLVGVSDNDLTDLFPVSNSRKKKSAVSEHS